MNAPVDVSFFHRAAKPLTSYRKYWAARFGTAKFLPTSRKEMDALGWDSCDIIVVTGDAYVDHPSFGMAVIGRMLEAQGFRVGIIAQPDWQSAEPFKALGKPNLFFGVTSGNMDSMINRYTADRKIRSDDAYTPGDVGGKRPDRAAIVYSQRCKEAWNDVPIILGGIEGSLRRIAHYDYWSDKVRRSVVVDSKCDLLLYGNAERAIVEIAHRLAAKEPVQQITDVRGTAFVRRETPEGWFEINSTSVDEPGRVEAHVNPYLMVSDQAKANGATCAREDEAEAVAVAAEAGAVAAVSNPAIKPLTFVPNPALRARIKVPPREHSVIRLPSYEQVRADPVLYAHANRVLHLETNPGNARALVQTHGEGATARDVWINPPPIPLTTAEMDHVFDLAYARSPHPRYADEAGGHDGATKIPAWEMIRFSVNIMRGCFGGCTFCSITEHEGRIIQSRSEESIIKEVEAIRDSVKGFTGTISDLGGPTANMYRLGCKSPEIEAACRKPSCVYPGICSNLGTNHDPLIKIYRRARSLRGIKKILIGSGLRYDLAVQSPEYVKELVQHHVGGYLKIAPEHTEQGPLTKMMKPGIGSYDKFKQLFEKFSAEAGKKQYLIPYFIAAHPGTSDEDMMNLAIWLKKNGFRADQVQTFYPSPMATATAMYHTNKNPLRKITRESETVDIVRGDKRRRLHKAFLRYHDANNWPLLREALKSMGRADLIGNGKHHLIPTWQPLTDGSYTSARKKNSSASVETVKASPVTKGRLLTQHTGLPPRDNGSGRKAKPVIRKGR
ncbi:YgiQ family radical SAM protein [Variovorax sp. J22G21]|uniref:YgiQ family radical SAM protein n=1 Tax=Variovorax fucosicus TaxID=3053517 RepID=UPI002575030B|nr:MULTISPECIES: YgiQ family radical SAM protein [unclassified Variovorax]MDM0041985.1 YgiQ family radical SAM protein [Variovorax sp. J22R193]MDM0057065.1 YgiQ family radical SAM protein [Variovorax sp. J22G47]MDM0059755.1 YgiQ family radical SAM protein [Variovorax sp. J22G21]